MSKKNIKKNVLEIAKKTGIKHLLKRKTTILSGGELQRVALARTLILKPKCLLLDEPLVSLDIKLRESLRDLLRKLNKEWIKVWFWEVKVRIWIHTWEAIIWNIWSEWKKLEFTALWDSVNLASRLEWVNKFYYTTVCVSEVVYIEAKEKFDFRYLDIIKVKWKDIWIKIYELIEEKWKSTLKQLDIAKRFEEWTNFYLNGQFEKALEIFSLLQEHWDKPSLTYIDRCKMYIKNSPWDDWDWIWRMKEK